jgi:hypothetical protein
MFATWKYFRAEHLAPGHPHRMLGAGALPIGSVVTCCVWASLELMDEGTGATVPEKPRSRTRTIGRMVGLGTALLISIGGGWDRAQAGWTAGDSPLEGFLYNCLFGFIVILPFMWWLGDRLWGGAMERLSGDQK